MSCQIAAKKKKKLDLDANKVKQKICLDSKWTSIQKGTRGESYFTLTAPILISIV